MTLRSALFGLIALVMFAAAVVVSMGPIRVEPLESVAAAQYVANSK